MITIDDLGKDVLKIIIKIAGPHYTTGVSKVWRQVSKAVIEERVKGIKYRTPYTLWGYSHSCFLTAMTYPNVNITYFHKLLDRFVYHRPMFGDHVKMVDFRRPLKKCLDRVLTSNKNRYFYYPRNVLALLDAVIVYFSLTKILRKIQPKYNGVSPKCINRGYYTDYQFLPRPWLEKYNIMDIVALLLLEDNYPRYINLCLFELLELIDEDKKKIVAVVLSAWKHQIPISTKVLNSLHEIAGTMGDYPYCQQYVANFLLTRN